MAIIDVGLLSGFSPVVETVKRVRKLMLTIMVTFRLLVPSLQGHNSRIRFLTKDDIIVIPDGT